MTTEQVAEDTLTCPNSPRRAPTVEKYTIRQGCCTPINPEENRFLRNWDMVTGMALIFVVFVSPYEVAFVSSDDQGPEFLRNGANGLFWVNRFIDLLFVVDMVLQFFIMYPIHHSYGSILVSDHMSIIKHYLRTWFAIDFLSILPFDILGIVMQSGDVRQLKVLRIVRLLRLLKLARLIRGLRILKRWELEISISYRKMTMCGLIVTVIISAHWIGCLLGIITGLQGEVCFGYEGEPADCTMTWFSPAAIEIVDRGEPLTGYRRYIIALYVAATVIVHPHVLPPKNEYERLPFIIIIFAGGFIWTRVISRSTALITSMDRHTIHFQQTMDDLNMIARQKGFPPHLNRRLRGFFMNTRDSSHRQTWVGLTGRMSPALKTEVQYQSSKVWIRRVPYLAGSDKLFLRDLTLFLVSLNYAQKETFGDNFTLYIMKVGMANWSKGQGKICLLRPGSTWGEEHMFLSNPELLRPNTTTSLTFTEVFSLARSKFEQVCGEYPEYIEKMRRYHRWYASVRGILLFAAKEKEKERRNGRPLNKKLSRGVSGVCHILDGDNEFHDTNVHAVKEAQARRNIRRTLTSEDVSMKTSASEASTCTTSPRAVNITLDEQPELEKRLTACLDKLEKRLDDRLLMADVRQAAFENFVRQEFAALPGRLRMYDAANPQKDAAQTKKTTTFESAPCASRLWHCNREHPSASTSAEVVTQVEL